ncbi:MAG TPA: HK97 family phage prohead protease [Bacillota bacterium]|nr:HK97 family phage prohead protease [Bacillota bacterium]
MAHKEIRLSSFENRSKEDMILEGYAAVFNQPTVLYTVGDVEYKEVLDRNAFANSSFSDCCLKYNHQDGVPILARTRGGSLELAVDDYGLFFRAKLFNTQVARDVFTLVKEGGLDKCSFAFSVSDVTYDRATNTRTIKGIKKLWDCAIVDVPAYDQTTVSARNFFDAQIELEKQERKRQKQRKKRLILLTEL